MHTIAEVGTNVPAFLGKLWKMVEDPITNDLISWSTSGSSFVIHDQTRFARELLPMYYKHNNMASFIRQLNMYGFHKIVSVDAGSLKQEFDEIKFKHPFFVRGHPYLLEHIKRKMTVNKMSLAPGEKTNNVVNKVLSDVRQMKGRQETMDSRLAAMKLENEALWRELSVLRQKHMKQQQIVNKLIQFLVTLVQPTHNLSMKRRNTPLMLRDRANRSPNNTKPTSQSPTGPVIHELDPAEVLLEDVLPETDPVLPGEEDSVLPEAETILPDAGPDSTSPSTDYFTIEDVENDVLSDSMVGPADEEDIVDLENLPAHFLTVDGQRFDYKNIIGRKVVSSPQVQQPQPSPGIPPANTNKRQPAAGTTKQRRPRTTKSRKRRKSSGGGENNAFVYSNVDGNSQQQVDNNVQMDSNGEYPTVVIDVPVNNINNIRMIVPQNGKKIQPVVAATSLLTRKNKDNNLIEETPIILDGITADMLVQPTDNSNVEDVATSTTPSSPVVENMNLDVTQADLTNGLSSPSVSNSELDMQIARMDPGKNNSPQLDSCWGQNKERMMTNGNWCGGKNRLEMDNHVENVQSDLDSLKELLSGDGLSLDANTLLGNFGDYSLRNKIFNSDDPMNYLGDLVPDNGKFKENSPAGNEVITYSPALFDLADMLNGNDWSLPDSSVIDDPTPTNVNNDDNNTAPKDTLFSEVNTPQFIIDSPSFPTPAKKRKK